MNKIIGPLDTQPKSNYIRNPYSCLESLPELVRSGAQEFIGTIQQKVKMLVETGEWERIMAKSIMGDKYNWIPVDFFLMTISQSLCKDFRVDRWKDGATVMFEPIRYTDWGTGNVSAVVYGYTPYIGGTQQTKDYPWESLSQLSVEVFIPSASLFGMVIYDNEAQLARPETSRECFNQWKDTLLNWNEGTAARFEKEVEHLVKASVLTALVAIRKKEALADDFLAILRQSQKYFLRISNNLNVEKPDQMEAVGNDWERNRSPMSGSLRLKYGFFESMLADAVGNQKIIDYSVITDMTRLLTFTTFGDVDFIAHWQNYRENPMIHPLVNSIINEWYNDDRWSGSWWVLRTADPQKSDDKNANALSSISRLLFNLTSLAVGLIAQKMLIEKALRLGAPNFDDRTKKFFFNEQDVIALTWKELRVSTQAEGYIQDLTDQARTAISKIRNLVPTTIYGDLNILRSLLGRVLGETDKRDVSCFSYDDELIRTFRNAEVLQDQRWESSPSDPSGYQQLARNPFHTEWLADNLSRALESTSTWGNMSSDFIGSKAYKSLTRGRKLVSNTIDRSWESLDDLVFKSFEADEVKAFNSEMGTDTEAPVDLTGGVQPGDVDPTKREDEVLGKAADEEVEKFISMEKTCEKSQESLYEFKF